VATSVLWKRSGSLPGPFKGRRENVTESTGGVPGTFLECLGNALVMFQRGFIFDLTWGQTARKGGTPRRVKKRSSGWVWQRCPRPTSKGQLKRSFKKVLKSDLGCQ